MDFDASFGKVLTACVLAMWAVALWNHGGKRK